MSSKQLDQLTNSVLSKVDHYLARVINHSDKFVELFTLAALSNYSRRHYKEDLGAALAQGSLTWMLIKSGNTVAITTALGGLVLRDLFNTARQPTKPTEPPVSTPTEPITAPDGAPILPTPSPTTPVDFYHPPPEPLEGEGVTYLGMYIYNSHLSYGFRVDIPGEGRVWNALYIDAVRTVRMYYISQYGIPPNL